MILEFDIAGFDQRLQVRKVLIDIGGVDHQILDIAKVVDQEIIDDTAIGVAHGGIHDLAQSQRGDIVGDRAAVRTPGRRARRLRTRPCG